MHDTVGNEIDIKGAIELYDGKPEINLEDAEQAATATSDAALTFNFHPSAASVVSPHPSVWNEIFIYSCAVAILFFAARSIRRLSASGYSLSLSDITFGPVLLGLFTECVLFVLFQFIPITIVVFGGSTDWPRGWSWLGYAASVESMLGYTVAGMVVWLTAKQNQLGEVILTALVILALDLILHFVPYQIWFGASHTVRHFSAMDLHSSGICCARRCLIAAVFIGAALGKKMRPAKSDSP